LLKGARMAAAFLATPAFAGDPCTDPANVAKANDALAKVKAKSYAAGATVANGVLAACPTDALATRALGQALVAQKLYDEAVTRMAASITAKKDQAYAYLWRGYGYYYKKQPDKMALDFEMFLRLAPTAPEAPVVRQQLAGIGR
jgi:tetratricopeptide (TPR) repeat protein